MKELIREAKQNDISDEEIAYLALCLARSGRIISACKEKRIRADIASTGGPASLTTLLCPLFLRAFDFIVPKLGVPGRPAGGIDVLAQIAGYQYHLDEPKLYDILLDTGYAHFLGSDRYAPLDSILFNFRKSHGALDIPSLVIASILSKKIALGVQVVGLDIRVALHGNFGSSIQTARENAKRFCHVAQLMGCKATCFLTNNQIPSQPFIGRGEALLALSNIFSDHIPGWLQEHVDMCFAMALSLVNEIKQRPSPNELLSIFSANLQAQGTSLEVFNQLVDKIKKEHRYQIYAIDDGFVYVDLHRIRDVIIKFQAQAANENNPFPDPCGVILEKPPGRYVSRGELIASIRISESMTTQFKGIFENIIKVQPIPQNGVLFEEVRYE